MSTTNKVRIAKYIADCGVCSRRKAEKLIEEKKVRVNGGVVEAFTIKVDVSDKVTVNGELINLPEKTRIWLFYKPKGCLTTNHDSLGRKTIFHFLPKKMPRVVTIGRLDYNTEGLLLLTNSGELARKMELPSSKIERAYLVKIYGIFKQQHIKKIVPTIVIEGIKYNFKEVQIIRNEGKQTWLEVTLTEGKNREIRKVFEHLNFQVRHLKRISYGKYSLRNLKPSEVKEVDAL